MKEKYTVGSYFGGCGAGLLGASWAGFKPDWIYEPRDFFNEETVNHNFPNTRIIKKANEFFPNTPTLMVGSPDCKQFSALGLKRKDREKGKLKSLSLEEIDRIDYIQFLKMVNELQPDIFILENVPNILKNFWFKHDQGSLYHGILYTSLYKNIEEYKVIDMKGYKIQTIILNSNDFGVPQSRKRVFVIGAKNFQPNFNYQKLLISNARIKELSRAHRVGRYVNEAFIGLGIDSLNHDMPNHSDERKEGFRNLKPGESYYGGQNNKRLYLDKPAGTVASHCSRFVHPTAPRVLTVRETARLMGYPDDFEFFGSESNQLDQAGKSVVPQVVAALSSYLRDQLDQVQN